jgi:hypothetical protein
MREPTFKAFAKPGASEVDVAESADALAQAVIPSLKRMVEGLIPVKKVLTPQVRPTFCVVDAQTSSFGGGGRERLSGREPPPRSNGHRGWRLSSSVGAELRVYGRRPHKRRIHPPIHRPLTSGDTSHHTLSRPAWTGCTSNPALISIARVVSASASISAVRERSPAIKARCLRGDQPERRWTSHRVDAHFRRTSR